MSRFYVLCSGAAISPKEYLEQALNHLGYPPFSIVQDPDGYFQCTVDTLFNLYSDYSWELSATMQREKLGATIQLTLSFHQGKSWFDSESYSAMVEVVAATLTDDDSDLTLLENGDVVLLYRAAGVYKVDLAHPIWDEGRAALLPEGFVAMGKTVL
jgi:hypothetical protein